jgi:glucose-6-phosphate 1-dehydrogenase
MMTALSAEWAENETYRIDHYLGKEMIKNMVPNGSLKVI